MGNILDMVEAVMGSSEPEVYDCKKCGVKGGKMSITCTCGFTKDFCLPCIALGAGRSVKPIIEEIVAHEKECKQLQAQTNAAARSQIEPEHG